MINLSGWWRRIGFRFHNDAAIPVTLLDGLPQSLIEGIKRPDDVALVRRDESQPLCYKFRGSEVELAFDMKNENNNQQTAGGQHHELHVWKIETLTIKLEENAL